MFTSGFSKSELEGYGKYWDSNRTEKNLQSSFLEKGRAVGREESKQIGMQKEKSYLAVLAKSKELPIREISQITGLSETEIEKL